MKSVSNCSEKKRKVLFSYAYFLTFPFKKLYHSLNSKNKKEILFRAMSKTYCYHIVFLKFFKNDCILVNSSTHYAVCKRDRIASKKSMYFQPEAFIHTYGAFPTAVLSQTCSRIYQLNYEPTSAWEKAQRA